MEIADDIEVFSEFYGRMVKQSRNEDFDEIEQKGEIESSPKPKSYEELQKMHLLDHLKVKIVIMLLIDEKILTLT